LPRRDQVSRAADMVWVPEGWDYEVIIGAVVSIAH
jgi:hypothetical protein